MILPGLSRPAGTIWCIGRNYAEHAKELGNEAPSSPVVFLKPASSLMIDGGVLRIPSDSNRVDHEVELVVAYGSSLKMAVGIDFTARDIQGELKAKGLPWTAAKGRPGFAAIGNFVDLHLPADLILSVNGTTRQKGTTADMLFTIEKLVEHLNSTYGLTEGDLIFTGTPSGVGPVVSGEKIDARLNLGESRLRLTVA
ncbi:MAG: fumarylacetoacetate hydrolase family protein [Elusimicrobiota bacterium]|nr:MAG: fumarylacetoacetate hydrolase family protein [Elusimicrobiota bacterium]